MAHQFNTSPNHDPQSFGARVLHHRPRLGPGSVRARHRQRRARHGHVGLLAVLVRSKPVDGHILPRGVCGRLAAQSCRGLASHRAHPAWQGAHLVERDGQRVARRLVGSLDELTERIGDITTNGHDFADAVAAQVDVRNALEMLSALQRTLVWRVDVEGYTVVEAARGLRKNRSYCQRELGKAREFIREYVVAA